MTENDASTRAAGHGARSLGPPLLLPVLAYAVLTFLSIVVPVAVAGAGPWASTEALRSFYTDHAGAARLEALFVTSAAIPLAVLTAVFSSRIRALGIIVPGQLIMLVGGIASSILLAISGLLDLGMISDHVNGNLAILGLGQDLKVAFGGTGFAAFMGLLLAGISVTGYFGRMIPRPLAIIGIVLALLAEVALLTTLTDGLNFLLPVVRYGSLLWLIFAAALFRKHRTSSS